MGHVTSKRPASGKSGRHLSVVPDDGQSALWAAGELDRLARLRQLAIETDAPADAIRLIDSAATADQAIDMLTTAGFMPSESESAENLMSWFAPLLESGCDQIEAEVCGSEFIGQLRSAAPPNLDIADVVRDIIDGFASQRRPEALAMMRVMAAVAPAELRTKASTAAAQMVLDGLADMPWTAGLGSPVPGRCFGYTDIYGEQRSMVITFRYGRKAHALVVLIDYVLGGGIKDCYVADYTDSLRDEYRRIGRDPEVIFSDLNPGEARAILSQALTRPICPAGPDQVEDVDDYISLLAARIAVLPEPSKSAVQAAGSATASRAKASAGKASAGRRPPAQKNVHRLKVTLRGTKPPIWRRLEVPADITLHRLHTVIQHGFGWQDSHLYVFETPAGWYGIPDPDDDLDICSAANKKLSAVADWPGDRIRYKYDFGDSWEHDVVVEAVLPAEPGVAYPRCTAGRRAGPPEDSGGVGGYADVLNVLASPAHEDHAALLSWLGIGSAAEFSPEAFDRETVNAALSKLAKVLVRP
jgi:hypothetical protein